MNPLSIPRLSARRLAGMVICGWLLAKFHGLFPNRPPLFRLTRRVSMGEREVWLTVDDGPCRHDTERLLRVLDRHDARVSFFCIGREIAGRPGLARSIADSGHTLENHTWSHRSATHWLEPRSLISGEIARCTHEIRLATDREPRFFRAPAGRWSAAMLRECAAQSLVPTGWSVRSNDGIACGDLLDSMGDLAQQLHSGAIVLFHQGGRRGRAEALDYLLCRMDADGWKARLPEPSDFLNRS